MGNYIRSVVVGRHEVPLVTFPGAAPTTSYASISVLLWLRWYSKCVRNRSDWLGVLGSTCGRAGVGGIIGFDGSGK
jgi:hypothetical protein